MEHLKREWKKQSGKLSLLQDTYQLLKDSPARREDYFNIVGSSDPPMPLKFSKTQWVKTVPVLERALEVLPHMATYVKAVE